MNKRTIGLIMAGIMVVGSLGMVFANKDANEVANNDPYKDDKDLQEIFKMYDNKDNEDGLLIAGNPMAEENEVLNVAKNGTIEIKLPENITTGCTWHIEIENDKIVKLVSDEYKDLKLPEEMEEIGQITGMPGVHVWNLKALKDGATKVTFKSYQDWEPEKVYEEKTYTVIVSRDGEKQVYVNPYADDAELQEIFKLYDEKSGEDGVLISENPEEDTALKVAKNGQIEIKLPENITTGCTWHIEIENDKIIKLVSDEYKDLKLPEEMEVKGQICGMPGVHVWNLEALKEGTTKITFKSYQDWAPEKVYEEKAYTVTVGKEGEKQVYVNPYEDDAELQEIFKLYEDKNTEGGLLLSPGI